MALHNQKLREILFLLLFAKTLGMKDQAATIQLIMEQLKVSRTHILRSLDKADEIISKIEQMDELLQKVVIAYDVERIQTIEKTALYLGIYDLFYEKELPYKVVISEALRLTKKFGTPAATSFVNAILDGLYKWSEGEAINTSLLKNSIEELQESEKISHEASKSLPASSDPE